MLQTIICFFQESRRYHICSPSSDGATIICKNFVCTSLLLIITLRFTWSEKNLLKFQQVSKYFEPNCLQNFLLLFISLLTVLIVKNGHILAKVFFTILKKRPRPNVKGIQYQFWTSLKRSQKSLSIKTNFGAFLQITCSKFEFNLCQRL